MIFRFDASLPLDRDKAARLLGGKGASLVEMHRMGLPVPAGVTLSTDVWRHFDAHGALPDGFDVRIREEVAAIGEAMGATYGAGPTPLLLAVRSGSPTSMPGMLETVLDVGLTSTTEPAFEAAVDARFARDLRRRLVESWASVVMGVPRAAFDALIRDRDVSSLDAAELDALLRAMDELLDQEVGDTVPDDPWAQLFGAIEGVLRSWRLPRAQKYRAAHGIGDDVGTAVTLQAMVFGNRPERSGAGVVFSRSPATGEPKLFGEWIARGQGEDVVGGRRTPDPLTRAQVRRGMEDASLESSIDGIVEQLGPLCAKLEERFGDAVDVEITIEDGRLWVLQCRPAKRTAQASARIAVDLHHEGVLSRAEALRRVEPGSLRQLLTPRLPDPEVLAARGLSPLGRGLAASPGAATGRVVFDAEAARRLADEERILVRAETSAEDVEAMRMVNGILTSAGGLTSHAAVVARAMGKPCVAGATTLHVDYVRRAITTSDGPVLSEGDLVTIDGTRGLVYAEDVAVEPAPASPHVQTLLGWADEAREARIFAEAGTARHAIVGRRFGADGIAALEPRHDPLDRLVAAAGEGGVIYRARSEDAMRAAFDTLRADRDLLLVDPDAVEAARALRGERALPIWSTGGDADGYWVETAAEIVATPAGAPVALRMGEGAAEGLRAAAERARPAVLVVAPLDVPVGRLLAGAR